MDDKEAISHKFLTKAIENSQKNLESRNFQIRKTVIQYDDVVNEQRNVIYSDRNKALESESIQDEILEMIDEIITSYAQKYLPNKEKYEQAINVLFNLSSLGIGLSINENDDIEKVINDTKNVINKIYKFIEEKRGSSYMRFKECRALLKVIDSYWIEHIDNLDQLKTGIKLIAIGQKDPVKEYTIQASDMFEELKESIKIETIKYIFA